MRIDQLKYVVTTIEKGSFSKAAEVSFCSPQAISKSIRNLEKFIGITLFKRVGNAVMPTAFAYEFTAEAKKVLRAINEFDSYIEKRQRDESVLDALPCVSDW